MDKQKLFKEALKKYGLNLQIVMFMEELSELTQRLSKKIRNPKYNVGLIAEEVADVENMIDQFKMVWNLDPLVQKIKTQKLYRLKRRLKRL